MVNAAFDAPECCRVAMADDGQELRRIPAPELRLELIRNPHFAQPQYSFYLLFRRHGPQSRACVFATGGNCLSIRAICNTEDGTIVSFENVQYFERF